MVGQPEVMKSPSGLIRFFVHGQNVVYFSCILLANVNQLSEPIR